MADDLEEAPLRACPGNVGDDLIVRAGKVDDGHAAERAARRDGGAIEIELVAITVKRGLGATSLNGFSTRGGGQAASRLGVMLRIEPRLRLVDRLDILERPLRKAVDRLQQRTAKLGQLIVDARRDGRRDRAVDDAVALEVAKVKVSMRCDTLGISRRSSLKRFEPSPSVWTTSTVHLSPMRESKVLMVRQTGLRRVFHVPPVPSVFPAHKFVRQPQKSAFLRGF